MLVLVVAVLVVSYASSLRAHLQQRDDLRRLDAEIAQSRSDITELQREKKRYADPAYVMRQARDKFGFVLRGEIGYTVLDENGEPLDHTDVLSEPSRATDRPQWYQAAWDSVLLAGDPPQPDGGRASVDTIKPAPGDSAEP